MTSGTREAFKRAVRKAHELGGHRNVIELGGGTHRVVGRQLAPYTVTVDADGEYACNCPAGAHGLPCWHAASVWLVAAGRAAFRPIGVAGVTP